MSVSGKPTIRQVTSSLNTGLLRSASSERFSSRFVQDAARDLRIFWRSAPRNESASKNHSRNHDEYLRYPLREKVLKADSGSNVADAFFPKSSVLEHIIFQPLNSHLSIPAGV